MGENTRDPLGSISVDWPISQVVSLVETPKRKLYQHQLSPTGQTASQIYEHFQAAWN